MKYFKVDMQCLLSLVGVGSIMLCCDLVVRGLDSVMARWIIQLLTK